ncbi:MAG: hypothetical protein Q9194_007450, partial [Teloschistes cf. exilis]
MDLWHDVHLSHPHLTTPPLPRDATLRALGTTNLSSIPLYLAAGPSLDVWTSDRPTQEWLQANWRSDSRSDEDKSETTWQERPGGQFEHGILLGVDNGQHEPIDAGLDITEILLYAASSETLHGHPLPLTPPRSSSPTHVHGTDRKKPSTRLYALPLSSHTFRTISQSPIAHDSDSIAPEDGYHLPFPSEPPVVQPENTKARKRAKIEILFHDASQNRRAQKKRGGEGVAKAMAGLDGRIPMPLPSPAPLELTQATKKTAPKRVVFSRASATGSLIQPPPIEKPISRPQASQRPTLTTTHHRSSLSLVETALSRIIMAGMRMYGLQPHHNHQRRKSLATSSHDAQAQIQSQTTTTSSSISADQEEYKAIYHQTFKAAAFVFRRSWRE